MFANITQIQINRYLFLIRSGIITQIPLSKHLYFTVSLAYRLFICVCSSNRICIQRAMACGQFVGNISHSSVHESALRIFNGDSKLSEMLILTHYDLRHLILNTI